MTQKLSREDIRIGMIVESVGLAYLLAGVLFYLIAPPPNKDLTVLTAKHPVGEVICITNMLGEDQDRGFRLEGCCRRADYSPKDSRHNYIPKSNEDQNFESFKRGPVKYYLISMAGRR